MHFTPDCSPRRASSRSPTTARAVLTLGFVSLLAACGANADSTTGSDAGDAASSLDSLVDGHWRLDVDRVLKANRPNEGLPADPLSEADYQPVPAGTTYDVVVSGKTADIAVGPTPFKGVRGERTGERVMYDLQAGGTFAGGRFVVSPGPRNTLQAELTLYGSGVPIAKSERGPLWAVQP